MKEVELLESAISEYRSMLPELEDRCSSDWSAESLRDRLVARHGWSDQGAEAVLQLVQDYGAFMLRNALALAVAMGREDGKLGF